MGMRAQSIERAIRQRPNQAETFEEMGRRPQLSGGEMTSLASALSGLSSGAGTYRGVSPRNVGFQEALTAIEKDRLQEEQRLMDDIKLAGLADEERARQARRSKPLDAFQRNLFQQRLAELPGGEGVALPTDMTFGQIEDDPILSQVFADLIPRTKGVRSVKDEILRNQELMEQRRLAEPISEIDRKFLNKKLQEAGIDKTLPSEYTYGDVKKNLFFSQFKEKLKGDGGGLTPYQQKQLEFKSEATERALRKEQRDIQKEEQKEVSKNKEETRKLASSINSSGLPQAWATMKEIEDNIPPKGEDIPGFGATGLLPTAFLSKKGKDLRTAFQTLLNVTLKDRSGAAVTPPEFERLKVELGSFTGATDEDFRRGIDRAKKALQETTRAILAGYPEDSYERYIEQGGSDFKQFISGPQGQKSMQFPMQVRKGNQEATVSNQRELDEARAEGWQ